MAYASVTEAAKKTGATVADIENSIKTGKGIGSRYYWAYGADEKMTKSLNAEIEENSGNAKNVFGIADTENELDQDLIND